MVGLPRTIECPCSILTTRCHAGSSFGSRNTSEEDSKTGVISSGNHRRSGPFIAKGLIGGYISILRFFYYGVPGGIPGPVTLSPRFSSTDLDTVRLNIS